MCMMREQLRPICDVHDEGAAEAHIAHITYADEAHIAHITYADETS